MVCNTCGAQLNDNAEFCNECGTRVNKGGATNFENQGMPNNNYSNQMPNQMNNQMPNQMNNQQFGYNQPIQQGENGKAIASMVLGIVSIVLSCLWYIALPAAIIAVILGVSVLKSHNNGRGMAIAGLITGIISLIPTILIIVAGASLASQFV